METEPVDALVEAAEDGVALDGLSVRREDEGYAFAVGGDCVADGLSEEEFRARVADRKAYVRNWYFWTHATPAGDDRWAFLRWIEDDRDRADTPNADAGDTSDAVAGDTSDAISCDTSGADAGDVAAIDVRERHERLAAGVDTEWGELLVTARLAEGGGRRYEIRHVDDRAVPASELTTYDDPLDARELTTFDERERYRPLKTAPSLRTGWLFDDLAASDLVRAVECFYPATIPNWYRERRGDLDVDHWVDTAERQTGIYDLIEQLPREAVEWVAESCCVDSQCLKRREWQYDEDDELAVDGGDGVFPCREPCSVVIAAARKWTILEGESERTYEFELTPSEKHQLEELIDAVADGRVDEIREADLNDGANRYRARYLRAKRFDEDGALCGVDGDDQ